MFCQKHYKYTQWVKALPKFVYLLTIRYLAILERHQVYRAQNTKWPPIFIIGPPRSGSTLIYQTMIRGLKLSYLCNLASMFPESPGIITKLLSKFIKRGPPESFINAYGETTGWSAPNQGRRIWQRWFGSEQAYIGGCQITLDSLKELRGTIRLLENCFEAPFITKSQGHSVRLIPLNEAFPDAVFVRIHRDPTLIAKSILRGREMYFDDRKRWFSAKPSNYDDIKYHEPICQICEQIYYLEKDMTRDSDLIGRKRIFHIRYEEFCNSPKKFLKDFKMFYKENSSIELQHRDYVPEAFNSSFGPTVKKDDMRCIEKIIDKLYGNSRS